MGGVSQVERMALQGPGGEEVQGTFWEPTLEMCHLALSFLQDCLPYPTLHPHPHPHPHHPRGIKL